MTSLMTTRLIKNNQRVVRSFGYHMMASVPITAISARHSVRSLFSCPSVTSSISYIHRMMLNGSMKRTFKSSSCALNVIPFKLADIGEGIAEAEVLHWYVKEGSSVDEFDKICDVQSDKATVEITSRYSGVVRKLYYNINDVAAVGKPLVDIETEKDDAETITETPTTFKNNSKQSEKTSSPSAVVGSEKVLTTPTVRRLAKEHSLNLSVIPATGRNGRLLKEDVLNFLQTPSSTTTKATPNVVVPSASILAATTSSIVESVPRTLTALEEDRVVPIRGLMRTMVKTMESALKVPHFGYSDEIVMDELILLREAAKSVAAERNIKVSFMPFLLKAASLALKQYPQLNAWTNSDCSEVTYKAAHNIGVAMDTPNGLIVPNVKHCEQRSVFEIAAELNRLQKQGLEGKLTSEDLSGGTFSLSNIGVVGGTYASPVVVVPEVVIGAIGKVQKLPRFDEAGNVVARHIMQISWSADHRVVDGVSMAKFSNAMIAYIQDPRRFSFDLK